MRKYLLLTTLLLSLPAQANQERECEIFIFSQSCESTDPKCIRIYYPVDVAEQLERDCKPASGLAVLPIALGLILSDDEKPPFDCPTFSNNQMAGDHVASLVRQEAEAFRNGDLRVACDLEKERAFCGYTDKAYSYSQLLALVEEQDFIERACDLGDSEL